MTLSVFLTIVLIHLAAAASPGPSFVVCLHTSINEGFRTAAALALGFGLGAVLWAGAVLAGLTLLFELVPGVFLGLKIIGGLFLIYIAYMMWRHANQTVPPAQDQAPRSALAAIRFGFLTFATNPKTAVFFGAIFAGLIPAGTSAGWLAAILLAVFVNETLWYLFVARVFSAQRARHAYARLKLWIDRTFGALIALFGLKIVLT